MRRAAFAAPRLFRIPRGAPRVAAQGLKHPEAGLAPVMGDHQGLVDEAGEQTEHLCLLHLPVPTHLLGRLQREAPGEHRQLAEQFPFRFRQQLIAPVDDGPQRLVAR